MRSPITRRLLLHGLLCSLILGLLAVAQTTAPADRLRALTPILYEVTPLVNQSAPRIRLTLRIEVPEGEEGVSLQMPVWSPGDYRIQNHAQYVQSVRAWAGTGASGRALSVQHPDDNTWYVAANGASALTVTYLLAPSPSGLFSENVQIRESQVFLNGPATYLYVVGRKEDPAHLMVHLPSDWACVVPLAQDKESNHAATFTAPDYDTLADSPLILAHKRLLRVAEFAVEGKPHRAVFFGRSDRIPNPQAFPPVLSKIVQAGSKLMGGLPYDRYDFLFDVQGRGGGLEHLNSTRIGLWATNPQGAAGLCAHEFFHAWNVKRIRPRALGPFNYIEPPRTRNLWFAEGVTEYYARILLRRAGLITREEFFLQTKNAIEAYLDNTARKQVTADESSWRVWEAGNSAGFGGLSYYQKGELIGVCLDLKIRHVTHNRRSLDDVMRELMRRGAPPKPGYEEEEIRSVVNLVAGQDLSAFYDLLARSTEEMPFAECLSHAGLDLNGNPLPNAAPAQIALRDSWAAGP